jgi:hypothetical protein
MRVANNYDYLPKWIVRPATVTRLSVHEVTEMAHVHEHNATAQLNYTKASCPETIALKYHFRRPLQGETLREHMHRFPLGKNITFVKTTDILSKYVDSARQAFAARMQRHHVNACT